jgi:CheY-like chemotaxis protein
MQIACPSCKKCVILENAKVPAGPFKIKCPGCGTPITVTPGSAESSNPADPAFRNAPSGVSRPAAEPAEARALPVRSPHEPLGLVPGSPEWERLKHEVAHQVLWHMGMVTTREEDEEGDEESRKWALVVDDESIFQLAISEALQSLRYRVETAPDKKTALDMLSRRSYDLVTVDNRLPDDPEGGMQVLQSINAMPPDQRRRMFVAFISADLSTMDTQSAFVLGANVTVGKKDIRRLDKILQQAIKEHDKIYNIFRAVHEELQRQEA